MRCVVTGGAGFIGSNLVDRLIADGNDVVVIDNGSSNTHEHSYWNPNAENHIKDINDYETIKQLTIGADVIFHLAAECKIQSTIENPRLAVETNTLGTCNVLQAAKENEVKRVVYSSTSAAYGSNSIPNIENAPNSCLNPYSVSKVAGEELCKMYSDLFGVDSIIFRYFNVYGNRQPTKGQYAPVIGVFTRQVDAGEPMTVVGDGSQRRDYVNVTDVVEANVLAATTDNKSAIGKVFNVGSETNHSVMDLVKMIGGEESHYVHLPEREGEVKETLSDSSRAYTYLGWKATIRLEDYLR